MDSLKMHAISHAVCLICFIMQVALFANITFCCVLLFVNSVVLNAHTVMCFVNLHKTIYLSNISLCVCALKVIQSLFALDCVVTVIVWLAVVHINPYRTNVENRVSS